VNIMVDRVTISRTSSRHASRCSVLMATSTSCLMWKGHQVMALAAMSDLAAHSPAAEARVTARKLAYTIQESPTHPTTPATQYMSKLQAQAGRQAALAAYRLSDTQQRFSASDKKLLWARPWWSTKSRRVRPRTGASRRGWQRQRCPIQLKHNRTLRCRPIQIQQLGCRLSAPSVNMPADSVE
jgi:hypothetical protein